MLSASGDSVLLGSCSRTLWMLISVEIEPALTSAALSLIQFKNKY